MNNSIPKNFINLLNNAIKSIAINDPSSLDPIVAAIGEAEIVLMGEATHGTEEFYQTRIEISKRLIVEKQFNIIAIEGDWTSCIPINNYISGSSNSSAEASLNGFQRFPEWMWRNTTIPPLIEWLKKYNLEFPRQSIGVYGLDLYCLNQAMQAVIDFLQQYDHKAAKIAIERYSCFDHLNVDPERYGYLVEHRLKEACIKEVANQLDDIQQLALQHSNEHYKNNTNHLFNAIQNARLVKNAELYYRSLFNSTHLSWNIRDQHMAETVNVLLNHLNEQKNNPAKMIIWAHNSHVGDARATEMSSHGELNLGQLIREQTNFHSFILGFSTHSGQVTAADHWGERFYTKAVQPALAGSYEELFHELEIKNFSLNLREDNRANELLSVPKLQRAIGVVYRPETERMSHYYLARLPNQFDAIVHFDQSSAVKPLDIINNNHNNRPADTYPFGI